MCRVKMSEKFNEITETVSLLCFVIIEQLKKSKVREFDKLKV